MQLFLDMDGVLADFNGEYERRFGQPLTRSREDPPGMWENIRSVKTFYADLPLLPDAELLWGAVKHLNPILLTGVPRTQVPNAEWQKLAWARKHLGMHVPVVCCRSRDKYLHGKPCDILIDDWERYEHLWVDMGGHFILHRSAEESLHNLERLLAWRKAI